MALVLSLAGLATGCGSGQDQASATKQSKQVQAPCRSDELRVRDTGIGGVAVGTSSEAIEFRSDHSCALRGSPSVRLLSRSGSKIVAIRKAPGTSAGPDVIVGTRPAYAELFYMNPYIRPKGCRLKAYYMAIETAGGGRPIKVKFRRAPMRFCPGVIRTSGYGSVAPKKP